MEVMRPARLDHTFFENEPRSHLGALLLDDPLTLATLPPLLLFAFFGRRTRARELMLLWLGYYLLMVIVVFHNEIRYRSAFVPFALAGAAGGIALLASAAERRRWPVRSGDSRRAIVRGSRRRRRSRAICGARPGAR